MHSFLDKISDSDGRVIPSAIATICGVSLHDIESTMNLPSGSLQNTETAYSQPTQKQLKEMISIINRVIPWSGDPVQAYQWYQAETLPSFGDTTAMTLVNEGKARAVERYIERIAVGGFS